MADISVTASSVVPASTAAISHGIAGGTITAGQPLYIDTADSDSLKPADANASSLTATVIGIALHGASDGQPIAYITQGDLTLNAVLTAGKIYVLTETAGGIALAVDLATGWRTSVLGVAKSTTVLAVKINNSDTANA